MTRLGLAAALAVALATPGAANPPYDSLPLAPPGALPGRIVYQASSDGCEFRSYDLRTGADSALGHANCDLPVLLSDDGRLAAGRAERDRVRVLDVATGKVLWLGPVDPERPAPAFSFPLFFSPDSSRLAYCTIGRTRVSTLVADARTGAVRSRIRGSCDVASTRRGVAFVRHGRVLLGRHVLYAPPRGERLAPAPGFGTIASNPSGSLVVVALRRSRQTVELLVLDLAGRVRGRYRGSVRIPLSPQRLAPDGSSAVVWWGCILQLAPFDGLHGRFRLLYGPDSEPITYPSYSPDGRYAAMARQAIELAPEPPPPPLPAVVFDGRTFAPLYRLPFSATSVAWVAQ